MKLSDDTKTQLVNAGILAITDILEKRANKKFKELKEQEIINHLREYERERTIKSVDEILGLKRL
jgi:hypothetical protein